MCFCNHLQLLRRQLFHAQVSSLLLLFLHISFWGSFSLTWAHFGARLNELWLLPATLNSLKSNEYLRLFLRSYVHMILNTLWTEIKTSYSIGNRILSYKSSTIVQRTDFLDQCINRLLIVYYHHLFLIFTHFIALFAARFMHCRQIAAITHFYLPLTQDPTGPDKIVVRIIKTMRVPRSEWICVCYWQLLGEVNQIE